MDNYFNTKMGLFIISIIFLFSCNLNSQNSNDIHNWVSDARKRNFGTVCGEDKNGEYCLIAYGKKVPHLMVDFDECLKSAKTIKSRIQRERRGMYCACLAGNWTADLAIGFYNCGGIKLPIKIIKTTDMVQ